MTVKFTLNSAQVPDGTVLLFGIRYAADPEGVTRMSSGASASAKVYTYAMLKAGGFWYVTGGGRTPQVAGWGAVERWLERDGREVVWVDHVTETARLWPAEESVQPAGRRRGSEWREEARTPEDEALGYRDL